MSTGLGNGVFLRQLASGDDAAHGRTAGRRSQPLAAPAQHRMASLVATAGAQTWLTVGAGHSQKSAAANGQQRSTTARRICRRVRRRKR